MVPWLLAYGEKVRKFKISYLFNFEITSKEKGFSSKIEKILLDF